jgi:serine/threonine protein kinase
MTPVLIVELATLLSDGPLTLDRYILEAPETIPLSTKVKLLLDVAEGLSALHAVGVTHADLKPSNVLIFLGEDNGVRAKLNDFGFVHLDGSQSRFHGGTTYWLPPECLGDMADGEHTSYESISRDLYSLGLVTWLVLFEEYPFGAPGRNFNDDANYFKLHNGYQRLLAERFDHYFQVRLTGRSAVSQFPLSAEWEHQHDIKNRESLEQVRYDGRKKSWVVETSGYQYLLRRLIVMCLHHKPQRRKKVLSIFLDEVVTEKQGIAYRWVFQLTSSSFMFYAILNNHPIVGVPVWEQLT